MQPYFFPYLGYFQLLNSVDCFVFYDDVNYIKSGWINRNRLYLSGAVRYFTVPLVGASSFEKIHRTHVQSPERWRAAMLASVQQSYAKAPYFEPVQALLRDVLTEHDGTIGDLSRHSVTAVAQYLELATRFVNSSAMYHNSDLRSVERVLDICRQEQATEYWNLPGGRNLYNAQEFAARNVQLHFIDPVLPPYPQFAPVFQPGLSILDALMFNAPADLRAMLNAPSGNPPLAP